MTPETYETVPDHAINLTERGQDMSRAAGVALREAMEEVYGSPENMSHCRMWVSPFTRTRETALGIIQEAGDWISDVRQSPFLVEQDWGIFEGVGIEKAAEQYPLEYARGQRAKRFQGRYWARMPSGESCFDVCCRVSNLFGTFIRDREPAPIKGRDSVDNVVIVSHGITIRALIMMWCKFSPEWFEVNPNMPNGAITLIEGSMFKGYVFGGFDHSGKAVEAADIPVVNDPADLMTARRSHAPSYLWTDADTAELQEIFCAIDRDGNGRISREEAKNFLGEASFQEIQDCGASNAQAQDNIIFEQMLHCVQRDAERVRPPFAYAKIFKLAARAIRGEIGQREVEATFMKMLREEKQMRHLASMEGKERVLLTPL